MSLVEPTIWEKVKPYKRWIIYGGLGLLLIGAALFLYQCGDEYLFKSKVQKQKDEIANELQEIKNKSNQIAELEKEKAGMVANINTATEQLNKDLFGREEIKAEANQALANFKKSVNANLDVNRSAQDLEDIVKRIPE